MGQHKKICLSVCLTECFYNFTCLTVCLFVCLPAFFAFFAFFYSKVIFLTSSFVYLYVFFYIVHPDLFRCFLKNSYTHFLNTCQRYCVSTWIFLPRMPLKIRSICQINLKIWNQFFFTTVTVKPPPRKNVPLQFAVFNPTKMF